MKNFSTEQGYFWAGAFGNEYINRNQSVHLLASNINFFTKTLQHAGKLNSLIEFGANIGMNLKAIKWLYPDCECSGAEINESAAKQLGDVIESKNVYNSSIFELNLPPESFDLTIIKGVLIHINPDKLSEVYQKLYDFSKKFILIAEYYNPVPVQIQYRGHENKLFKRDFAGEFLSQFKDTRLIDYGFAYKNDPVFPQDDITWFLIEKKSK